MKKLALFAFLLLLLLTKPVQALYEPRTVPNNQFGIHIVDPVDLDDVDRLVNSNGGKWGYVKFVIPDSDRNTGKWDSVFRELRRKKLIPIVRLATHVKEGIWAEPTDESIADWPAFLNSLSWPTENRYIILFNEPNHSKEWGGKLDPDGFGAMTVKLAKKLKTASADYFILPAGLDVSAQSDGEAMNAEVFLRRVIKSTPEFLQVIDGWTSHSYPNPAFSASPYTSGRGSLRSYQWEMSLLRSLGLNKDLPVLIGETGWIHSGGEYYNPRLLSPETVAQYISSAGENVWHDRQIFAITPFLLSYQGQPFDHFSWRKFGTSAYYPMYSAYRQLSKTNGHPKQKESYEVGGFPIPDRLVAGSVYGFSMELKNTGQVIISSDDQYVIVLEEPTHQFIFAGEEVQELEPDQSTRVHIQVRTPEKLGTYHISLKLQHGAKTFDLISSDVTVLAPPTLKLSIQLGWRKKSEATGASVLVYDGDTLLNEYKNLPVEKGTIVTPGILSITPDQNYRIVTIVPYYLPRQVIQPIGKDVTEVINKRFLPLDANNDGKLTVSDFLELLYESPSVILPRFFN